MLQRTLAQLLLFTLLLTQALSGVCHLRCNQNTATTQSPSCHSMPMADEAPNHQASTPCSTHPCPTSDTLLASTTPQQYLSTPPPDAPQATLPEAIQTLNRPAATQPIKPPASPPPIPQAPLLKTALRV